MTLVDFGRAAVSGAACGHRRRPTRFIRRRDGGRYYRRISTVPYVPLRAGFFPADDEVASPLRRSLSFGVIMYTGRDR